MALCPETSILGDANCELIHMYEAIHDEPDSVMAELDSMYPHTLEREYYYAVRRTEPASLSPAKRAARFIFLNKTCYNGLYRVNALGRFNVPFGRYTTRPTLYNRENLLAVCRLLQGADLHCGDFATLLESAGAGDFAYLDPPYAPLTATASFTRYTAGAFGEAEQRRLADVVHALTARGCQVLLSNSDTPLVRELYKDERYFQDRVYAPRNINSDAGGRKRIAELAIRNYRSP